MSWVMSEKHGNREGSTQKSSVTKQKCFVQEQAVRGMLEAHMIPVSRSRFLSDGHWSSPMRCQNPLLHGLCCRNSSRLNDKELLGLQVVVPGGMDNTLFGKRLP